ncbi:hypothetical protein HD806DRAFT_531088 [Xylariaceae sp. AK1471]|nr:hypothetical protein HD806DRAFT_531088 [Xylariaceae sp. AK1471]
MSDPNTSDSTKPKTTDMSNINFTALQPPKTVDFSNVQFRDTVTINTTNFQKHEKPKWTVPTLFAPIIQEVGYTKHRFSSMSTLNYLFIALCLCRGIFPFDFYFFFIIFFWFFWTTFF